MKKLFCILISSVLLVCAVFALAGCGPKSQKDNNSNWQYNVEIPNASTGETETYTYTSFILLVRIKATDSTAHSRVHVLEYQLSYEPAE